LRNTIYNFFILQCQCRTRCSSLTHQWWRLLVLPWELPLVSTIPDAMSKLPRVVWVCMNMQALCLVVISTQVEAEWRGWEKSKRVSVCTY
jgi:hypothetical protein